MNPRAWHGAVLVAAFTSAAALAAPQDGARNQTPAEQSVEQGSGTGALGPGVPNVSGGTAGGGSGATTSGPPGLAVDEGTVMRPLSAHGTNRAGDQAPVRRKQLYGLNPKADEPRPTDAR